MVVEPPMLSVWTVLARHLLEGVQRHAHAGGTNRVAAADQTARRIDRQATSDFDGAVLDGFPGLARCRHAQVLDGHVLGGGEAVVGLDRVQLVDIGDPGTRAGVVDGALHLRKHIGLSGAGVHLAVIADRR